MECVWYLTYVPCYLRTCVHDSQVESPVSLLSQDMSREYLHQQDARKKYEVKYLCDVCVCVCVCVCSAWTYVHIHVH